MQLIIMKKQVTIEKLAEQICKLVEAGDNIHKLELLGLLKDFKLQDPEITQLVYTNPVIRHLLNNIEDTCKSTSTSLNNLLA